MHPRGPFRPFLLPLFAVSLLVAGCGGGEDANAPEPAFPDVAGVYNITGTFDGLPSSQAFFNGTLTLTQSSRQSGTLGGTLTVTATLLGEVVGGTRPLQEATVTPSGAVTFRLIGDGGESWIFTGNHSGNSMSGRHTLSDGATSYSGDWTTASAPPPATGSLQITTATSGSSPDPDGYTVTIDGTEQGIVGASGGLTINTVTSGTHLVGLGGVAANCQIQGDNPRAVTVPAGGSATVAFAITCTAPPPTGGTVRITTVTTGPVQDPDGYEVSLDGAAAEAIANNEVKTLSGVTAGAHTVTLSDVAGNCTVADGSSRNITVTAGAVSEVSFTIACTAGPPSASRSTVDVAPASIPVGGTSTITVRVRDAGGNPVAGVLVSLSSSDAEDEITPASANSNENGVATFSFTSIVGGDKTITAVAGGVTLDEKPVITVVMASSTTEITGHDPNPSESGETIHVTFTVTGNGGRGEPTGEVTIYSLDEADVGCTVPVSQGSCDFALTEVGIHTLGATYSGDDQFEDSVAEGVEHEVRAPEGATAAR
jgi:hypothetical protein